MQTPKPPKKVKATDGCKEWLTPGKEYDVTGSWGEGYSVDLGYRFFIAGDDGEQCACLEFGCGHLNFLDWIVTERED